MTPIKKILPLSFQWETQDPFLFCVFHKDNYPKGNDQLGPAASLEGRSLGQDFDPSNDWRMYHGTTVPGFPQHPHRGFETITIVPEGLVDHSDSLGGAGRFGNGDVQWMTAGKGINHAEMFPLLDTVNENPLSLFQIWLNLPQKSKFVAPHFAMLWNEEIPIYTSSDEKTKITVIAGQVEDVQAPTPAPNSWANDLSNEMAIWIIEMEPNAEWEIPTANAVVNRSLYFYEGDEIRINDEKVLVKNGIELIADQKTSLQSGTQTTRLLLLQGKPISEPVARYGPFVMNTQDEIRQAMIDYQRTQFGGWPWSTNDHVHPKNSGRFARHTDGREENK